MLIAMYVSINIGDCMQHEESHDKSRRGPKRLMIDVPEELHTQVKMRATMRNTSIRHWVLLAIRRRLREEEQYD